MSARASIACLGVLMAPTSVLIPNFLAVIES